VDTSTDPRTDIGLIPGAERKRGHVSVDALLVRHLDYVTYCSSRKIFWSSQLDCELSKNTNTRTRLRQRHLRSYGKVIITIEPQLGRSNGCSMATMFNPCRNPRLDSYPLPASCSLQHQGGGAGGITQYLYVPMGSKAEAQRTRGRRIRLLLQRPYCIQTAYSTCRHAPRVLLLTSLSYSISHNEASESALPESRVSPGSRLNHSNNGAS
jgi:hypothetical protein